MDERGNRLSAIDGRAIEDVNALINGENGATSRYIKLDELGLLGVPKYSDLTALNNFKTYASAKHPSFKTQTIGSLVEEGVIEVRNGHGSPSIDLRFGDIPYIKVSDLRAGLVNINRTNLVPLAVAEKFWGGRHSGLRAYDVLTPSRACKNIGEPVVLLPDQTDVVLTKEMIVFRPGKRANFDSFYLALALNLETVCEQWDRIIFMQTNREDVGNRYLDIEIPIPSNTAEANAASKHYRDYYMTLADKKEVCRSSAEGSSDIATDLSVQHGDEEKIVMRLFTLYSRMERE